MRKKIQRNNAYHISLKYKSPNNYLKKSADFNCWVDFCLNKIPLLEF